MGLWTDACRPWAEATDRTLAEHKEVRDTAAAIAPQVVGAAVKMVTGQPLAGSAASVVTTAIAKNAPDLAARIVIAPIVGVAAALVPIVATPILLGVAIVGVIKSLVSDD